jgi:hypothetical protein
MDSREQIEVVRYQAVFTGIRYSCRSFQQFVMPPNVDSLGLGQVLRTVVSARDLTAKERPYLDRIALLACRNGFGTFLQLILTPVNHTDLHLFLWIMYVNGKRSQFVRLKR